MKKRGYGKYLFIIMLAVWGIFTNRVQAAPCTEAEHKYHVEVLEYAEEDKDGVREYVCIYCGDTYQESIPRMGHHYGEFKIEKAADCAHEGVKIRTCIDCGMEEREIIPYLEVHEFGEWYVARQPDCTQEGVWQRVCGICGYAEQEDISPTGEHLYQETTYPATCTQDGEIVHSCIYCGNTYSEKLEALGHKWSEPIIKKESTTDSEGLMIRICENDKTDIWEEAIPMLPETEQETETETVTEPQTDPPAIEPEPKINELDAVLGVANMTTFGTFFFFLRRDWYVINWDKKKKARLKKQGVKR